MKKIMHIAAIIALLAATACQHAPKADEAKTTEPATVESKTANGTQYIVDRTNSVVKWIGTKPTGQHHGTLMLKEGILGFSGNKIENGHFVIDLESLQAYDDDGSANTKLQGHLKSEDFFNVAKYSAATFEITNAKEGVPADKVLVMKDATHTITGNLKIKDVTKSITFPVRVIISDGKITADANFNINRTDWGINYHSDKSLGDKFINEEININLHIIANK